MEVALALPDLELVSDLVLCLCRDARSPGSTSLDSMMQRELVQRQEQVAKQGFKARIDILTKQLAESRKEEAETRTQATKHIQQLEATVFELRQRLRAPKAEHLADSATGSKQRVSTIALQAQLEKALAVEHDLRLELIQTRGTHESKVQELAATNMRQKRAAESALDRARNEADALRSHLQDAQRDEKTLRLSLMGKDAALVHLRDQLQQTSHDLEETREALAAARISHASDVAALDAARAEVARYAVQESAWGVEDLQEALQLESQVRVLEGLRCTLQAKSPVAGRPEAFGNDAAERNLATDSHRRAYSLHCSSSNRSPELLLSSRPKRTEHPDLSCTIQLSAANALQQELLQRMQLEETRLAELDHLGSQEQRIDEAELLTRQRIEAELAYQLQAEKDRLASERVEMYVGYSCVH
jgi:hypothetical protein